MKKLLTLLLALTLVFALAACGNNGKTPSASKTTDPGTAQSGASDNKETGNTKNTGNYTQKQMEDTIISYFTSISSLTSLTLCNGSSIEYEPADIPWQTVDMWTIYEPAAGYDELAASMSAQLTAAGLTERKTENGGYEWSVAAGDKAMRVELRPEDWADGAYMIYATPEAE